MLNVAIQGFTGSYHAIAAEKLFGNNHHLVMCDSFVNLFRKLESGEANCAVMAIENTIAGTILFNYSLLRNSRFKIFGETFLRIEHCLLALEGQTLDEISEVRSHPMALMQCVNFFSDKPKIKLVEDIDTAYVAELIAQNQSKGIAAIAGEGAAKKFNLQILKKGIEDSERNFTRFLIIAPENFDIKAYQNKVDVPNKASIYFSLPHKIGGLSKVMNILSDNQLNVTAFQSTPYVGNAWEYFFHSDVEFDNIQNFETAVNYLANFTEKFQVLGIYSKRI
jgi:prephenate dehydratase